MEESDVATPDKEIVVALLRSHGADIDNEASFSFTRLGEGRGFCSLIYRVSIGGGTKTYAVKITDPRGNGDAGEGTIDLNRDVHARECALYEWAAGYLAEGGERTDLARLARSFGASKCADGRAGLLVMEDLSDRMTNAVDFSQGYSVDVVKSIIRCIAGYQSAYLSAEKKFPVSDKSIVHEAFKRMTVHCVGALPEMAWLSKDKRSVLLAFGESLDKLQDVYSGFAKTLPLTLNHCDLWPNNMLFELTEDHPEGELLAVVDWQCAGVGNALLDVASAIGVCLTPANRRLHELEMLDFYLEEMEKRKHRFREKTEFDRETVIRQYRESLKWAALQLVYTAVFNPTADEPETEGDDGPLSSRLRAILEDM